MHDTIAALATPPGEGGIAVVRISGPDALNAAAAFFVPTAQQQLHQLPDRLLSRGRLYDADRELLDDAMAVVMRAGHSYTGEETVELHCHGSPVLVDTLLSLLFSRGVRLAQAGEFTRRAFLNGRLDLTQAEAVIDLITAPSAAALHNAAAQLQGRLQRELNAVWQLLTDTCAHFYACIDYPDDDISDLDNPALAAALCEAEDELQTLAATRTQGRLLREGIPVAILGKPNVGKSSLLNALLGYDRAIVSARAGTTRDTVSEALRLDGKLFTLTDTAGLHDSADDIESEGIQRSRAAAQQAALKLIVLDSAQPLTDEDHQVLSLAGDNSIIVCNKADLPQQSTLPTPHISVSTLTGSGLGELTAAMVALVAKNDLPADGSLITNARQADAIGRALSAVTNARRALVRLTPDVVVCELEAALDALGQLTGRSVSASIVDTIFSRFCVGK